KLLYKDKSNMSRLISILEEKNLIEKQCINSKSTNIFITGRGRDLHSKIAPVSNEAQKCYFNNISQDDMYICIKVLTQIQKNLEKKD
ncbi:MAG: hypothetical protein LUB59_05950, partial [Candidatus Gastranaerophilales bacterium]|nr:hypothetical protein [Candidatus Gastranaerophilales bacterium]